MQRIFTITQTSHERGVHRIHGEDSNGKAHTLVLPDLTPKPGQTVTVAGNWPWTGSGWAADKEAVTALTLHF